MRALVFIAGVAAAVAATQLHAGADLVLRDGGVLSGESVERTRDGLFLLTIEDGSVLTIPVNLVKSLRLTGGEDPAPTGIVVAGPENVAGPKDPIPLPSPEKQLAAFGRPPATFARSNVNPTWRPGNALGPDVTQFNPARWYKTALSMDWTPVSAFRASKDVTQFNPVRWYKAPTDSSWRPTDGWR